MTREYQGKLGKSTEYRAINPTMNPGSAGLPWISLVLRLAVGGVLFYAGFLKAIAPAAEFAAVIQTYRLVPPTWAMPLATALPWIEMWIGTFVIFGYGLRATAPAASLLFTVFLAALGSAMTRHLDLTSCGCFGPEMISPRHTIFMDAVLLIISFLLFRLSRNPQRYSLDRWLIRG